MLVIPRCKPVTLCSHMTCRMDNRISNDVKKIGAMEKTNLQVVAWNVKTIVIEGERNEKYLNKMKADTAITIETKRNK